jgi:hypothetical protein
MEYSSEANICFLEETRARPPIDKYWNLEMVSTASNYSPGNVTPKKRANLVIGLTFLAEIFSKFSWGQGPPLARLSHMITTIYLFLGIKYT